MPCWTRVEHEQVQGKCENWRRTDLPGLNRLNQPSLPSVPTIVNKTLEIEISIWSSIWGSEDPVQEPSNDYFRGTSTNCTLLSALGFLPHSLHSSLTCWGVTSSVKPSLRTRKQRAFDWLVRLRYGLSDSIISYTVFFDKIATEGSGFCHFCS